MSDDTEQQTRGRQSPTEPGTAIWPGLGQILAGLGVVVTGAAFLVGWIYTRAFYEQLGIPTRALDLGPTDYATAKVEIWYAFALAALGGGAAVALAGQLASLGDVFWARGWWRRYARWPVPWPTVAVVAVGSVPVSVGVVGVTETGEWGFLFPLALGAVLGPMAALWGSRAVHPQWMRPFWTWGAALLAIAAVLGVLAAGKELGRHDAEALLAGPEEGSGARFVAAEPLGLPGERYESDVYVTDSVGVVRATDNAYFVVVRGTKTVYCLPAARVLRIEYTPHEGG